jgi:hypothetical protein
MLAGRRLPSPRLVRLGVAAPLCLILAQALPAQVAPAGDLAAVKQRGKLVMLTYPVQGTHFISVNLDAMRERGLKLVELRQPEQFQGIDVELKQATSPPAR